MSTDLLPLASWTADSAAPVAAPAEGETLTLQLRARRPTVASQPMAGTMAIRVLPSAAAVSLHARVVAADATPITITFA